MGSEAISFAVRAKREVEAPYSGARKTRLVNHSGVGTASRTLAGRGKESVMLSSAKVGRWRTGCDSTGVDDHGCNWETASVKARL